MTLAGRRLTTTPTPRREAVAGRHGADSWDRSWWRGFRAPSVAVGVLAAMGVATACGTTDEALLDSPVGGPVTIGVVGENAVTDRVVAELWARALDRGGVGGSVVEVPLAEDMDEGMDGGTGQGVRAAKLSAVMNGRVDVIPEYTADLLRFLDPSSDVSALADGSSTGEDAGSSDEDPTYRPLSEAMPDGVSVLDPAPMTTRTGVVIVERRTAHPRSTGQHGVPRSGGDQTAARGSETVPSVSTLARSCVGYSPQRPSDPDALRAWHAVSGCSTASPSSRLPVMTATVTTDPRLLSDRWVPVTGGEASPASRLIPVVIKARLDRRAQRVLNEVDGGLTTDDLAALVEQWQQGTGRTAVDDWLTSNGF